MSQSIQPEKFVEIQDMAKAYVAELEGDENNVHVLPTMRDAAYNAYCDAYHDGFISGASSLQGEVERLQAEVNRLRAEMCKMQSFCEDQERDWRSVEDDDNARFWHGLKNEIQLRIYPPTLNK